MRRRHEAADRGGRRRENHRRQVQDFRLRLRHRFKLARHRVDQRPLTGWSLEDSEHGHSQGTVAPTCQATLLK